MANRMSRMQRAANRLEVWSLGRFGRSPVSIVFGTPVLILETIGRRSGVRHSTPLAYGRFSCGDVSNSADHSIERIVIVGGAAGQRRMPDWVANLRESPRAAITVDGVRVEVDARELVGVRRDAVWPLLVERWPRIVDYERHAGRPIPVFELHEDEPVGGECRREG